MDKKRKTTRSLRKRYNDGEKIVMVTCYDATFARLVELAEIDVIWLAIRWGT